MDALRDEHGEGHPDTVAAAYERARLLQRRGRHADALPLLERCLAARAQQAGPRDPRGS